MWQFPANHTSTAEQVESGPGWLQAETHCNCVERQRDSSAGLATTGVSRPLRLPTRRARGMPRHERQSRQPSAGESPQRDRWEGPRPWAEMLCCKYPVRQVESDIVKSLYIICVKNCRKQRPKANRAGRARVCDGRDVRNTQILGRLIWVGRILEKNEDPDGRAAVTRGHQGSGDVGVGCTPDNNSRRKGCRLLAAYLHVEKVRRRRSRMGGRRKTLNAGQARLVLNQTQPIYIYIHITPQQRV